MKIAVTLLLMSFCVMMGLLVSSARAGPVIRPGVPPPLGLPVSEANGGTGGGALTCAGGSFITSDGTVYSCVSAGVPALPLSVANGGTGSATNTGSTSYVALQPSGPGSAQTGYVNVSGGIVAGSLALGTVLGQSNGGTGTSQITCSAGQFITSNGTIYSCATTSTEHDFSAYQAQSALGSGTAFAQTVVANASTLVAGSNMAHDIAGTGTGTFVAKLCSDGVTCAGGNVYLTCTAGAACAAAVAGRIDACTITKSAVPAATTLTWSVGTACGTLDPGVNVNAHFTTP